MSHQLLVSPGGCHTQLSRINLFLVTFRRDWPYPLLSKILPMYSVPAVDLWPSLYSTLTSTILHAFIWATAPGPVPAPRCSFNSASAPALALALALAPVTHLPHSSHSFHSSPCILLSGGIQCAGSLFESPAEFSEPMGAGFCCKWSWDTQAGPSSFHL